MELGYHLLPNWRVVLKRIVQIVVGRSTTTRLWFDGVAATAAEIGTAVALATAPSLLSLFLFAEHWKDWYRSYTNGELLLVMRIVDVRSSYGGILVGEQ